MASDNIALDGVGSTNVKSLTFSREASWLPPLHSRICRETLARSKAALTWDHILRRAWIAQVARRGASGGVVALYAFGATQRFPPRLRDAQRLEMVLGSLGVTRWFLLCLRAAQ